MYDGEGCPREQPWFNKGDDPPTQFINRIIGYMVHGAENEVDCAWCTVAGASFSIVADVLKSTYAFSYTDTLKYSIQKVCRDLNENQVLRLCQVAGFANCELVYVENATLLMDTLRKCVPPGYRYRWFILMRLWNKKKCGHVELLLIDRDNIDHRLVDFQQPPNSEGRIKTDLDQLEGYPYCIIGWGPSSVR